MEDLIQMWGLSDHVKFKDFFLLFFQLTLRDTWVKNVGKSIPGRGNSMLKDSEVVMGT